MAGNLGNMKDIIARIDEAKKYESWGSQEPEPSAAYLGTMTLCECYSPLLYFSMEGPKLWDKHLSLQEFDEDDFSVMNIEEFLEENNIQVDVSMRKVSPLIQKLFCRHRDSSHRKTVRVWS